MTEKGIGWAAGALTHHAAIRTRLRHAIEDNLAGQPKAMSFESDRTTGFSTVLDEDGDPMPAVADPTGEAAIMPDRARRDLADLEHLERQITQLVGRIADIDDRYLPRHLPDAAGRAKLASPGAPGCWYCWEYAHTWTPPHTQAATTVGGILDTPRHVCSSCYFFIARKEGRAPTAGEVRHFHGSGQGRWPKKLTTANGKSA